MFTAVICTDHYDWPSITPPAYNLVDKWATVHYRTTFFVALDIVGDDATGYTKPSGTDDTYLRWIFLPRTFRGGTCWYLPTCRHRGGEGVPYPPPLSPL